MAERNSRGAICCGTDYCTQGRLTSIIMVVLSTSLVTACKTFELSEERLHCRDRKLKLGIYNIFEKDLPFGGL